MYFGEVVHDRRGRGGLLRNWCFRRQLGHEFTMVRHLVRYIRDYFGNVVEETDDLLGWHELRDRIRMGIESLAEQHLHPTVLGEQLGRPMFEPTP